MGTNISEKVLQDLEFPTVLEHLKTFCNSSLGKASVAEIKPIRKRSKLLNELQLVYEYANSLTSENRLPNHGFNNITPYFTRLAIENSFIEAEQFLDIASVSETVNELKKFLKKFETYFPTLFEYSETIEFTTIIIQEIRKVITPQGTVDDKASPELRQIRRESAAIRSKIGQSFTQALAKAASAGYLDDIKETVVDNQRVLAVLAMHRRKVSGSMLGASKSGNIVYIAPQATLKYARELQNLNYEEQQEILRILRALADQIRPFTDLLKSYVAFLTHLDVIAAKANYGQRTNSVVPKISTTKELHFINAYHPLLYLKNNHENKPTVPQTISLHKSQQIIVISGPNAGGKSITLKTIGLLQTMLQSGMMIPVDEKSTTYIFDTILTDIGDNQSIENQLSTYSYRLKNMRNFLKRCNENTLFLIDEFGTGSDPELGGALAEIFLEEFYHKDAYGIITTHYSNLKVLANELEHVVNANMQFDERSLEPLYKLYIGQAGSSLTFEVAQKNGIPFSLINRAKKRVESEKIRLDKTISKLQKERIKLQKSTESLEKQHGVEQEKMSSLEEKELRIQEKLAGFQELYDSNQRMLTLGRKINEFLNTYFQTNNKKELTSNFIKWVSVEKTKHLKKNPKKANTKKEKKEAIQTAQQKEKVLQKVEKEVLQKVVKVRATKKKEAEKIAKEKAAYVFKVNDRVRLLDGNAVGTIEKIEKKSAFINYGIFTTQASIDKLELVEKAKK